MDDQRTVAVGIGELYVTREKSLILASYGLGSCVGVSVYDPISKIGGLAHVMLPNSKESSRQISYYKFADIAIPALIQEMLKLGAKQRSIICKIAGGAQMLTAPGHVNGFRIGERNVEAVMQLLRQHRITPTAMDTGGSQGRTLRLFIDNGSVFVRTVGGGDVEL